MSNILIIEDDQMTATMVRNTLTQAGLLASSTDRPSLVIENFKKESYDVLLVDIGLPEMSGLELIKEIRNRGYKGFIMIISSMGELEHIVEGLNAGADQYMVKPFKNAELVARVKAMIRRKHSEDHLLKNGELEMDLVSRVVQRQGKKINLTSREFNLLEFFMRHRDEVVDRNAIALKVWGEEFDPDSNVIDVYINHLRKKVDSPFPVKLLKTVVGHGYVMSKME